MTHRKTIVAYFSASGTTASVAAEIAKAADADLFEIRPEKPYTAGDLDWTDRKSRSSAEMKDESARPAIAGDLPDLSAYDTLYIGFPIWWGIAPRIINTFMEGCDLSGRKIVIFATSGGSSLPYAVDDLRRKYPDLDIAEGKLLNGHVDGDII